MLPDATGEAVMVWVPIVALTVLVVSLLIVVRDAAAHSRE